jgi:LuxR family maltose regulon positive regulatory protein
MTSDAAPAAPRIRPALLARADSIGMLPLALVVAPAGSGKSTLLAAWRRRLAERDAATAYLDLSPLHADASVLAADLLEVARHALPAFGAETTAALTPSDAEAEPWRRIARAWQIDARTAAAPLVIFLDNFHELATDSPGARLIDELLRARIPQLGFVVASRGSVPPVVARLRSDGALVELDANDLSLRFDEVQRVLMDHGAGDDPELVARVLARTEGWATGVQLAGRRLARIDPAERGAFVERLGREPDLFGFVANEVLRDEPPEVLAVARAVALLGRCTALDVVELLGDARAAEWIAHAVDRGVLLADHGEVWIHQLWRDRIAEKDAPDDAEQCRTAGNVLWRNERYEEALALFARAQDWDSLARALLEAADPWARAGRSERVRHWLAQLPEGIVERTPAMLALHGLAWIRSAPQDALAELERAMQMYRSRGERTQERALAGTVGVMYLAQLRRDDALRVLRRLITLRGVVTDRAERGGLYVLLAQRRFLTGRWGGALSMAQRAAEMPLDPAALWFNTQLLAWLRAARGEVEVSIEALDRAIERSSIVAHSFFHCGALLHRALLLASHGDPAGALRDATRVEDTFREHRMPLVQEFAALGMARAHSSLGDRATARRWYEDAVQRAAARGGGAEGPVRAYLAVEAVGWGDDAEAGREAARALAAIGARGDRWSALMPWLFGFALWALARGGDPRRAHEIARSRRRTFSMPDLPLAHHTVGLALADVARAAGDETEARRLARAAFESAARAGLRSVEPLVGRFVTPHWAAWAVREDVCADYALDRLEATAPERVVPLLAALARDRNAILRERGVRLLARRGGRDAYEVLRAASEDRTPRVRDLARTSLATLDLRPPFRLRIQSLGGFEIARGEAPIRADDWKGHTARRLLVRLLVAEGRAVARERLREDLWPDAEPEAGRNNLRVAASRLNDVLDPDRPAGAAPHFVVAEGETLALRRDAIETWDVTRLRMLLAAAGEEDAGDAFAAMREAIALYAGPFAPEIEDAWVAPLRREIAERFVTVAHAVGPRLVRRNRLDDALALADRVLRDDPADERAAALRMRAQLARGDRSAALRSWADAQRALGELGLEPGPELAELARRIRAGA